jgi:hypothetical protein
VTAAERLTRVRERIEVAAVSVDRDPAGVQLIAVSKTQSIDAIRALYDLGVRHFGESRLQEAIPKIEALPSDIEWHFIGHLQSNKARRVAEYFHVIQTLSSAGQIAELSKQTNVVTGLIEVNIAREEQKSGILMENLARFRDLVLQCKQVHLRGLMTIGPLVADQEQIRPFFRELAQANQDPWLSMGMSDSLEVGIQEGATHVRVGTSLFGERD